jgi:hypothetical protein
MVIKALTPSHRIWLAQVVVLGRSVRCVGLHSWVVMEVGPGADDECIDMTAGLARQVLERIDHH